MTIQTPPVISSSTVTVAPAPAKPWYQSWVLWLNSGALAFVALALTIPQVMALIPTALQSYAVAAVLVINLYLRLFVTKQPIQK